MKAKDNDGAYSTVASCSFTVGTDPNNPPSVSITNCPSGDIGTSYTFQWQGSDSDGSVTGYYYDLDDSTPDNWTTGTSKSYSNLSEGNHTFYVKAKDNDGAYSTVASCSFTVDLEELWLKITFRSGGITASSNDISQFSGISLVMDSDCELVFRNYCCSTSYNYAIRCDPRSSWPTRDAEFYLDDLYVSGTTQDIQILVCGERGFPLNPLLQIDSGVSDEDACDVYEFGWDDGVGGSGYPCFAGSGRICDDQMDDSSPVIKIGANPADCGSNCENDDRVYIKTVLYMFEGWHVRSSGTDEVAIPYRVVDDYE